MLVNLAFRILLLDWVFAVVPAVDEAAVQCAGVLAPDVAFPRPAFGCSHPLADEKCERLKCVRRTRLLALDRRLQKQQQKRDKHERCL
jgi:hypothetical protein